MSYINESYGLFLRDVKNILNANHKLSLDESHQLSMAIAAKYILYCDKHEDYILTKLNEALTN